MQLDARIGAALFRDPLPESSYPAQTLAHAIPSGELNLNAVLYLATGLGPHPTVLLLHGLPGNEQNIDCAQSIRRAGWNVLTIHYRGAWGSPGSFTFQHCLEDAEAALCWLQQAEPHDGLRIDPNRLVLIGHSMGGFVAAQTAALHPEVVGVALISGVDLGQAFGRGSRNDETIVDDNVGVSAGLHILAGTSPQDLVEEARAKSKEWSLSSYANSLAGRPVLLLTADDGFADGSDALADAIRVESGTRLTQRHFRDDHSYSNCRVELQRTLLGWLLALSASDAKHEQTCR
jgi:pimeloyl-ACP methyl ester carboxylesterase